jgi:uncharacterized protein YjiS (DUF1127 family)
MASTENPLTDADVQFIIERLIRDIGLLRDDMRDVTATMMRQTS